MKAPGRHPVAKASMNFKRSLLASTGVSTKLAACFLVPVLSVDVGGDGMVATEFRLRSPDTFGAVAQAVRHEVPELSGERS